MPTTDEQEQIESLSRREEKLERKIAEAKAKVRKEKEEREALEKEKEKEKERRRREREKQRAREAELEMEANELEDIHSLERAVAEEEEQQRTITYEVTILTLQTFQMYKNGITSLQVQKYKKRCRNQCHLTLK